MKKQIRQGDSTPAQTPAEYIAIAEAAQELGVDRSTLRRWIKEGRIEAQKVGKQWRVRRGHLARVIEIHDAESAVTLAQVKPELLKKFERDNALYLSHYGLGKSEYDALIKEIESQILERTKGGNPKVRRLVAKILYTAVHDRSSDVHVEPMANHVKIRYRVDGVLYEMHPLPRELSRPLVDEMMRWAGLNPNQRHLPQDGRFLLNIEGREIDFRMNSLPANHGNLVCLRVLDRSVALSSADRLGFEPEQLDHYRQMMRRRNGVMLISGPTGCGKTTTIYATLSELNIPPNKIMTVEDPIEFDIDGIDQTQIRPDVGLGFSETVRAMLRQAPTIMCVGEIRSPEVGQLVCQASLTGHLVFSTLHANDTIGALIRLVDMGIPPFLIVDSVNCILTQRLLRLICNDCKTEYQPKPKELDAVGLKGDDRSKPVYHGKGKNGKGKGCRKCHGTAYCGRTAVFEMLEVNRDMRKAIANQDTNQLIQSARAGGWKSLREVALNKVFRGDTTIEEVIRETPDAGGSN